MPSLSDPHAGNVGWKGGQGRLKADKHGFIQRLGEELPMQRQALRPVERGQNRPISGHSRRLQRFPTSSV